MCIQLYTRLISDSAQDRAPIDKYYIHFSRELSSDVKVKFETTNYQIIYGKDKVRNDMEDEFYIDLPMPIISLNVFQLLFSCRNSEYETAKRGLTF